MRLDRVPSGSIVFIDSTVFIYHFTGVSPDCRDFLERCERRDVKGITSTLVLAETAHRLMMIEAVSLKLVTPSKVPAKLRATPSLVKKLRPYSEQTSKIPLMGIEVAPVDLRIFLRATEIQQTHGLLMNDSLVAAAAETAGVDGIASADRDFGRLALELFFPSDLS